MKTLRHLEQKRHTWLLIALCTVFFLLRLPSLMEPYWYGDEGIYQVISLAMQQGKHLYAEIWDNKPPLLYVMYFLFSGDQFSIRLFSAIVGMLSVLVFFSLSQRLLSYTSSAVVTTIFALLFATPYLEGNIANAENFMLLPVILAGWLIYSIAQTDSSRINAEKKFFVSGLLLGIAFLFKIVAFFDFLAFFTFIYLLRAHVNEKETKRFISLVKHGLSMRLYVLGFTIPIVGTLLYFNAQGTLSAFIQSAFLGNVGYVGYGNAFIIPQGFLIIKLIIITLTLLIIISRSKTMPMPVLFISIWFIFALFSAFFSQRPYTHYLLILLPSVCLLTGLLLTTQSKRAKISIGIILSVVILFAISYFNVYGTIKTFQYYQNIVQFLSGQKSVTAYQSFFDWKTPRDYDVVSYINSHTTQNEEVFIWGDSPQIYALSNKLPPGKYTVAYHIMEHDNAIPETQAAIDKVQPKFIITLEEAPPLPFHLPGYVAKYGIKGASVYERAY